ncbi:hypothetical protein M3Y99_01752200 [Aphelenchoides fujianensis]|nr:hypothetical protein M3Y99_01752200 [Aphelenchoides fujianensis]
MPAPSYAPPPQGPSYSAPAPSYSGPSYDAPRSSIRLLPPLPPIPPAVPPMLKQEDYLFRKRRAFHKNKKLRVARVA